MSELTLSADKPAGAMPPGLECLEPHQVNYRAAAWSEMTCEQLSWWVRLLVQRSYQRTNQDKADNDLENAANYLAILQYRVDHGPELDPVQRSLWRVVVHDLQKELGAE